MRSSDGCTVGIGIVAIITIVSPMYYLLLSRYTACSVLYYVILNSVLTSVRATAYSQTTTPMGKCATLGIWPPRVFEVRFVQILGYINGHDPTHQSVPATTYRLEVRGVGES
ncbi:hypothetical protein F5Y05DRAFT_169376 [Hypoxylon sp. FL0543]|nr:hypothetical protein F5Y05DRAFT_169376 [Hypoxylon sp. FL0543]